MQDLRLVGVHDDGEHLLLADTEGEHFLLPVDEALRAAVRRDRAHLGQLQIEMTGTIRPRDVQARIRSGASAEEVARASGWPVEKVRRYEGPVVAEREHVADLARRSPLRRRGREEEPQTLGERVLQRLEGRGVPSTVVEWDSWRGDGGPWTVCVRFPAGGRDREARWRFEPTTGTATAEDDEARWLSEDDHAPDSPLPGTGGPRLVAVETRAQHVYDVDADGGVRTGTRGEDGRPRLDLMEAMRSRRQRPARTPRPASDPGAVAAPPALVDPRLDDATVLARLAEIGEPPAAHPPTAGLEGPTDGGVADGGAENEPGAATHHWTAEPDGSDGREESERSEQAAGGGHQPARGEPALQEADRREEPDREPPAHEPSDDEVDLTHHGEPVPVPAAAAQPGPARPAGRKEPAAGRRSKRASVPSWDDIMFGGRKD